MDAPHHRHRRRDPHRHRNTHPGTAPHLNESSSGLLTVRLSVNRTLGSPDLDGVDLDALDPIFFDLGGGRAAQKARFGGELLPNVVETGSELEFAEELDVAEQQIQRYESTGYGSASLARLCDVVAALGVEVREVISLPGADAA